MRRAPRKRTVVVAVIEGIGGMIETEIVGGIAVGTATIGTEAEISEEIEDLRADMHGQDLTTQNGGS